MAGMAKLDGVIARLLLVKPQPQDVEPATRLANRAIGGSLLFSAVRCTIQYMILPIVLPLLGIASTLPLGVLALFDLLIVASLVYTLRQLWHVRHPRRWDYLFLASISMAAMVAFLVFDLAAV